MLALNVWRRQFRQMTNAREGGKKSIMKNISKAGKPANMKAEILDSAASNPMTAVAPAEVNSVQEYEARNQKKPLSVDEQELLTQLEDTIRKGFTTFSQVDEAFAEIHDKCLYRAQYGTFEEYCRIVWNISRSKGQRSVAFIKCVENLKCSQLATSEPLAIPANELQGRKMATRKPEQQIEIAKNVAKKTSHPTTKDFDEAAEQLTEDEPMVQSYDIRDEGEADDGKPPVIESGKVSVPLKFDAGLVSLKELQDLAVLAYNTFSNSTKKTDVEKTLWKLKEGLKEWADWQAKQLNLQEAA
jgi:hypothetical protein